MNLELLKPGHRIRTVAGREAEVLLEASSRSEGVRVAYLAEGGGPYGIAARTGDEDMLTAEEVEALLGAVPPGFWQDRVGIVLHYVPESDEGAAEYRAETLWGVPNNVKMTGGSENSGHAALDHLLGGLFLLGFRGRVQVDDDSGESGEAFRRYEVEVGT